MLVIAFLSGEAPKGTRAKSPSVPEGRMRLHKSLKKFLPTGKSRGNILGYVSGPLDKAIL